MDDLTVELIVVIHSILPATQFISLFVQSGDEKSNATMQDATTERACVLDGDMGCSAWMAMMTKERANVYAGCRMRESSTRAIWLMQGGVCAGKGGRLCTNKG